MKGTLLKDLPLAKAGEKVEVISLGNYSRITFVNHFNQTMNAGEIMNTDISEWLEPIVEKKTYDDLKKGDNIHYIDSEGEVIECRFHETFARSETFLTREEAEDEHKRREWAVRPDKFIPKAGEDYWYYNMYYQRPESIRCFNIILDVMLINNGLCFRTREECEKAIKEHDLIRLFYTIR